MWKSIRLSSVSLCIFAWMHRLHWDVRDTDSLHSFQRGRKEYKYWSGTLLAFIWTAPKSSTGLPHFEDEAKAHVSDWVIVEVLGVWYVLRCVFMWYMHFYFIFCFYYLLGWNSLLIHIILSQLLSNQLLRAVAHAGSIDLWSMIWITHMN